MNKYWKPWEVDEAFNIERIDDSRKFETALESAERRLQHIAQNGGDVKRFADYMGAA
jgi:hypothetical protein